MPPVRPPLMAEIFTPAVPDPDCKPCPFCGGVAELMTVPDGRHLVRCHECRAATWVFAQAETARVLEPARRAARVGR